ncbi:N-acetylglucosamine transport system permease protein [Stackebrandtia albiflava]|uniref:N-acetylglucosamine transport system permease protein n=1 Tax=Stackebrandtia albiflava TaxID=406432 RepID=A0A562VBR1_9ACTN|nr:carbohydrate ABC transporter permease [Stackebrandtia albiflava]TWJ15324.1 N-acetylglucosamine transport system permease protein [Stackebrandtia albiflava]
MSMAPMPAVTEEPVTREEKPRAAKSAGDEGGKVLNAFSHGFLVLWAAMVILPVVWIIVNSFRPSGEIKSDPFGLPSELKWSNFSGAWVEANLGQYFVNTVVVLLMSVTGTMLLGAMAAYVLARYTFFGNRAIFLGFVAGMMFPVFLALFPLYKTMDNVGLKDTHFGLALVYIAYSMPFTVFFLTAFFRSLPTGVAEAAMIDGAGHYRLFFRVMLPMAKPGLISITIFNVIGQWNQFILPLVLMGRNPDGQVLSVGLSELVSEAGKQVDTGVLFAGMALAMLPVLIAYILFQRQIQAGMTAGALK